MKMYLVWMTMGALNYRYLNSHIKDRGKRMVILTRIGKTLKISICKRRHFFISSMLSMLLFVLNK